MALGMQFEMPKTKDPNDPNIERWTDASGVQHTSGYGIVDSVSFTNTGWNSSWGETSNIGTKYRDASAISSDGVNYTLYDGAGNSVAFVNTKTGETKLNAGGSAQVATMSQTFVDAFKSQFMSGGNSSLGGGRGNGSASSGGGGSGGGGTSGGGGGGNTSSGNSGKSNQQRYLENLVATGNYGQKEWAKDQLKKGLYDSGGVLEGTGGIKATVKDETVFGPELSSKLLSPQKSKEFLNSATALTKMLDNSSTLNAMLGRFANLVGGGNSVSNDSHDIYLSGNPLGNMTKSDSFALTSILRRYIPISGGGR